MSWLVDFQGRNTTGGFVVRFESQVEVTGGDSNFLRKSGLSQASTYLVAKAIIDGQCGLFIEYPQGVSITTAVPI